MKTIDVLIVGHGIAGAWLADSLRQRGVNFCVVNHTELPSASRVAAGICNPITGRKLNKTWRAEAFFSTLHSAYPALEKRLGASFFHPVPLYRPFKNREEQNEFIAQSFQPEYADFLCESQRNEGLNPFIHNNLGGIDTLQAAWVNLPLLLDASEKKLRAENNWIDENFNWEDIQKQPNGTLNWQNIQAKWIVSCEGASASENPYFKDLPWALVRGEVLTINSPECKIEGIVNSGVWLQAVDTGVYRVGATYRWENLDEPPSEKARNILINKLLKFFKPEFTVLNQRAGVRPATSDRRPFLGKHATEMGIAIFGGMGSKAVSMTPSLVENFVNFLLDDTPLPEDVDIRRFTSQQSLQSIPNNP